MLALALIAAGCSSSSNPDTADGSDLGTTCIEVDDRERCWTLQPASTVGSPTPLIVDLHGFTGTAEGQRSVSGFAEIGEREGVHVVWPTGVHASWNAGRGCCGRAVQEDVDDVGFVRTMIDEISEDVAVDLDRVYLTGLSNGCAMAQRFAADASDAVAAVACMALYLIDQPESDYSPVPVMELHGTDDRVVRYEGGDAFTPGGSAPANLARWAELNSCVGTPADETLPDGVTITTHADCAGDTEAILVTIEGAGHLLYQGEQTRVDTTELAWEFLRRFSKS
ncbi:MAG: alpha/beta hydrolase family esterase [Acidimicrobiales bacterium]